MAARDRHLGPAHLLLDGEREESALSQRSHLRVLEGGQLDLPGLSSGSEHPPVAAPLRRRVEAVSGCLAEDDADARSDGVFRPLLPYAAIDALPDQVSMPTVACILLDHVDEDFAPLNRLAVAHGPRSVQVRVSRQQSLGELHLPSQE